MGGKKKKKEMDLESVNRRLKSDWNAINWIFTKAHYPIIPFIAEATPVFDLSLDGYRSPAQVHTISSGRC